MSFSIHINHDKQLLYVLGQDAITALDIDQYYTKLKTTMVLTFVIKPSLIFQIMV